MGLPHSVLLVQHWIISITGTISSCLLCLYCQARVSIKGELTRALHSEHSSTELNKGRSDTGKAEGKDVVALWGWGITQLGECLLSAMVDNDHQLATI